MPEKKIFFDVVEQKTPETASPFLTKEHREERRPKLPPLYPLGSDASREARKRLMWIMGVLALVVLAGGFGLMSALAGAVVSVTPRTQSVPLNLSFKVYPPEADGLPHYQILQATDTESISVPASGTKLVEKKAQGVLVLYNAFSRQNIRIIPNTRFQTSSGKIFRSHLAVNVPGYKVQKNKITPGKVEVNVTADKAGADYNVGPSNFTLPGLSGTLEAKGIYARSSGPMIGGFSGQVNVVADSELAKAKATLEGTVSEKLLSKLKAAVPADKISFESHYPDQITFDEYGSEAKATPAQTQTVSSAGTASLKLFDKQELAGYLARQALPSIGETRVLIANWPELSANLDQDNLRLSGQAKFVWVLDQEALKNDLAGRNKNDYAKIFLNYPSIDKAEVSISPFWSRTFPKNPSRIIIKERLN